MLDFLKKDLGKGSSESKVVEPLVELPLTSEELYMIEAAMDTIKIYTTDLWIVTAKAKKKAPSNDFWDLRERIIKLAKELRYKDVHKDAPVGTANDIANVEWGYL